jgi:hypothetical protein
MPDPRLMSLHLEGQPRREQFRAARDAIHAACGTHTLAGDVRILDDDARLVATTMAPHAGGGSASASGKFTFYLKDGSNVYPLHFGKNYVGRLPDNDVVIRDECVSRRHCAVLVHTDLRCEIVEMASKNGTVVNGKKIDGVTKLQSGDQIVLCNRRLTFHVTDAPESAVAG